jgi:hypothetical protein
MVLKPQQKERTGGGGGGAVCGWPASLITLMTGKLEAQAWGLI